MSWHLFIMDPKRYSTIVPFVRSLDSTRDVVYKMTDSTNITKAGKKTVRKVAVFPGYLFVESNEGEDDLTRTLLLEHPYIRRYVGSLSNEDIEHLYKIRKDDGYSKKFVSSFVEGDVVKITAGLFKNYEAVVISVKQKEIMIETDLNGKKVKYAAKPGEITLIQRQML